MIAPWHAVASLIPLLCVYVAGEACFETTMGATTRARTRAAVLGRCNIVDRWCSGCIMLQYVAFYCCILFP